MQMNSENADSNLEVFSSWEATPALGQVCTPQELHVAAASRHHGLGRWSHGPRGELQHCLKLTMTMTHSQKVLQQQSVPGPMDMSGRSRDPVKKESVKLLPLALLASCASGALWTTMLRHTDLTRKTSRLML